MQPLASRLWASFLSAAKRRWGQGSQVKTQIVLCWSEELIIACPSNEEKQKRSAPCLSRSYHEATAALGVGEWVSSLGSVVQWPVAGLTCCPLFRCLPSPQAAWTGDQQKCFIPPFILDPLKPSLLLPGCLYCFFITKSLSIQCQSTGLANQECAVSSVLCSWGFLTHGAWSLRSSGLISAVKVRRMWNLNPHEYHYAPEFSQILHAGTFSDPLQGYSSWKIK